MRPLTDFSVVEHRSAESGGMKFDPSWGPCRTLVKRRKNVFQ